jgi:hypothetical protein
MVATLEADSRFEAPMSVMTTISGGGSTRSGLPSNAEHARGIPTPDTFLLIGREI